MNALQTYILPPGGTFSQGMFMVPSGDHGIKGILLCSRYKTIETYLHFNVPVLAWSYGKYIGEYKDHIQADFLWHSVSESKRYFRF